MAGPVLYVEHITAYLKLFTYLIDFELMYFSEMICFAGKKNLRRMVEIQTYTLNPMLKINQANMKNCYIFTHKQTVAIDYSIFQMLSKINTSIYINCKDKSEKISKAHA